MFDDVLKSAAKAKSSVKSKDKDSEQKMLAFLSSQANTSSIEESSLPISNAPKRKNRNGKRTDPDYKQVGAYVRKDTYLKIQKHLLDQPDKDFSDLVQELLSAYLDNQ